jgi:cytoskeleton protein RodZ
MRFCDKAARQIERLPSPEPSPAESPAFRWRVLLVVAALLALAFIVFRNIIAPPNATEPVQASNPLRKQAPPATAPVTPSVVAPAAAPSSYTPNAKSSASRAAPVDAPQATPATNVQRIELKAIEPTWVGITIDGETTFARLLDANQSKIIESPGTIRVRLGNAGGVEITADGKPIGSAGRKGQVRLIEFASGSFTFVPIENKPKTP